MFFDASRLTALESALRQLQDELRLLSQRVTDVDDVLTRRVEKLLKRATRDAPPVAVEVPEPGPSNGDRRAQIQREILSRRHQRVPRES